MNNECDSCNGAGWWVKQISDSEVIQEPCDVCHGSGHDERNSVEPGVKLITIKPDATPELVDVNLDGSFIKMDASNFVPRDEIKKRYGEPQVIDLSDNDFKDLSEIRPKGIKIARQMNDKLNELIENNFNYGMDEGY